MACSSGACESGCYKDKEDDENQPPEKKESSNGDVKHQNICLKCKVNVTIAATHPQVATGEAARFCVECFRSNLYGKFKLAVTSNAMISPSDKVLVAFSGGICSRVVLQFVHEMQYKAQKNFDACPDRSLPVFGVGVAFVDETAIYPLQPHQVNEGIEEMKAIVSQLTPPVKEFHVVPISSIYSSDSAIGEDKLNELINYVSDATGREDLILHLRMLSLQKFGAQNGFTKVVLGSCTSSIACHVLAATVKGQGYSLAADIQHVDARWEIPVVLPLRDCLAQELKMLCHLDRYSITWPLSCEVHFAFVMSLLRKCGFLGTFMMGSLRTVAAFEKPRSGINGLISSFVKILQEENPSRESTIVRTGGKLTPFHFNRMPESDDAKDHLASRRRQKKYNLKPNESLPPDSVFCPLCNSPFKKSSLSTVDKNGQLMNAETFGDRCCLSCQFQMLPKDSSSIEHFYSVLPQPIVARAKDGNHCTQRWLREQIQDCLLSDNEDGT